MSSHTILSDPAVDSNRPKQKFNTVKEDTTLEVKRQSSPTRSSLESTTTILPPYNENPDRPRTRSDSSLPLGQSNSTRRPKAKAHAFNASSSSGPNAAAVRAVFAPSDPRTDKMHTTRPKKVEDYDEDPTYKGKLARMTGSTSKWNYFGHDIEQYGNPFKSLMRKK